MVRDRQVSHPRGVAFTALPPWRMFLEVVIKH